MTTRRYDFHGIALEVESAAAAVGEAIDSRLRHFRTATSDGPADLRHEVRVVPGAGDHQISRPPGPARPVYDPPQGEVLYVADADALWIDVESRVRVLSEPGRTRVSVTAQAAGDLWLLSRPMFTIPLVERLKRLGLYSLHAAAAAIGDRALLLPGASGSGKSTLALVLARAGWDFMADDMVFVGEDLRVRAFPDEIDVSAETARWFPELALDRAPEDGWPKHRLRTDELFGGEVARQATPAALVSPWPAVSGESTLEPLPRGAALLELTPNVLLTDAASSQAHLDAIGALVAATPAHRLATGRDFDSLAERLATLVR